MHLGSTPFNIVKGKSVFSSSCTTNGHPVHTFSVWLQQCYAVKSASGTPVRFYDLFHAQFLWLSHGLGQPDPLYILPVLAGVTQWVQMRMMATRSSDPQQQMMNQLMNFMPLMIVFFALRYASGLSLYWVTSTIIGILIQYRITGTGLLPRPAAVMALISGGIPASRPARTKVAPVRRPEPRPAALPSNPNGSEARDAAATGNGSTTRPQNKATAGRPRARANRAKGGRGGGRRG
jgi:hypothetical protein